MANKDGRTQNGDEAINMAIKVKKADRRSSDDYGNMAKSNKV
jgi:hypothetical protein